MSINHLMMFKVMKIIVYDSEMVQNFYFYKVKLLILKVVLLLVIEPAQLVRGDLSNRFRILFFISNLTFNKSKLLIRN